MDNKTKALIELLGDENKDVAVSAMAELLVHCPDLGSILQELQEDSCKILRRRVHQLQAIMKSRHIRDKVAERLSEGATDLIRSFIDLHFLWYDSDNEESFEFFWKKIFEKTRKQSPRTTKKLAELMRELGYTQAGNNEMDADYYCLGTVLEDKVGADVLLCAITLKVASQCGIELKIIHYNDGFALLDNRGQAIIPAEWRVETVKDKEYELWSVEMILKYVTCQLFTSAVSTDSIRYVYTIGSCLSSSLASGEELTDFLYPFPPENN